MCASEEALQMLQMAHKDLKALRAMTDEDAFDTEIFGFHAQQATEKAAKAWLTLLGLAYPKVHDLEALLDQLAENGQCISVDFRRLEDLTDFGVQFRYTAFTNLPEDFSRQVVTALVTAFVDHVATMVAAAQD